MVDRRYSGIELSKYAAMIFCMCAVGFAIVWSGSSDESGRSRNSSESLRPARAILRDAAQAERHLSNCGAHSTVVDIEILSDIQAGKVAMVAAPIPAQEITDEKPKKNYEITLAPEGIKGGLSIPFKDDRTPVTDGGMSCPVVIVGKDIWHIQQKRVIQTLKGEYNKDGLRVLSGNGEWFVVADGSEYQKDKAIHIWHAPTGELRHTIPGDPEWYVQLLKIFRNKYLIVGGRHSPDVQVWDVSTGAHIKTITTGRRWISDSNDIAVNSDGTFYALYDDKLESLSVYQMKDSLRVAAMEAPRVINRGGIEDPDSILSALDELEFSPNTEYLAAISSWPENRVYCWNNRGKIMINQQIDYRSGDDVEIKWLPDSQGFIVDKSIIDLSGKVVHRMNLFEEFAELPIVHIIGENRLLARFRAPPDRLVEIEIPWKASEVDASEAGTTETEETKADGKKASN